MTKVYVPNTEISIATRCALIPYEYIPYQLDPEDAFSYSKYFTERFNRLTEPFVNIEHDVIPWPGAIESIINCPEPWCGYNYHLKCHQQTPLDSLTSYIPLGCVKFSEDFIRAIHNDFIGDYYHWHHLDRAITQCANRAQIPFHQHYPGVINANPALLSPFFDINYSIMEKRPTEIIPAEPGYDAEIPHTTTISAVITRADGTVEDLGVIAAHHQGNIDKLKWRLYGERMAAHRIQRANKKHLAKGDLSP